MDWHENAIVARDYTRMRDRPKRMYRFGGPLPQWIPAINMQACGVAVVVAIVWGAAVAFLSVAVPPLRTHWWVAAALFLPPPVLVGWMWSRPIPGSKLRPASEVVVRLDYAFQQPRRIEGLSRSQEPERLHWQVIFWSPAGPSSARTRKDAS